MAATQIQHKTLFESQTTTGRSTFNLPNVPSLIGLFITIVSGTATIDIEVGDENVLTTPGVPFFALQTINATSLVVLSIPASVIGVNVTAVNGEVKATYCMSVGVPYLDTPIRIFSSNALTPTPFSVSGSLTTEASGTNTRIYGPAQPTDTAATIYTVPASKVVTLKSIHATNTTASPADFSLTIGVASATTEILSRVVIAADDYLHLPCDFVLGAAEILQAYQTTVGAITLTLNGNVL